MGLISLLDVSRRALSVQTQGLRTIGDNISNVNTPGYSRRRVDLVTTTSASNYASLEGTGVDIKSVIRVVDNFLNTECLVRTSDRARSEICDEILGRAEAPFSLDNQAGSIVYNINEFFSSLQDLSTNPADVPLRTAIIQNGQALADSIRQSYQLTADLQREADNRIDISITEVNRITSAIASLNAQISSNEASTSQESLTLRDQRDLLLTQLSENLSFQTFQENNGQVNVCLSNGFALVSGTTSRELDFVETPSFAPAGGYPFGLDGGPLGHIVYDFTGNGQHAELTDVIRSGGGEIAGLLSVRGTQQNAAGESTFDADGDLVTIASRLEVLSRDLLMRFNEEYQGGGTAQDLDGNTPIAFGLFSFDGAIAGNNFGDILGHGVADQATIDALVASGIYSFAGTLTFKVNNERQFAAARSTAPGDDANVQALVNQRDQSHAYVLGSVSETSRLDDFIDATISRVGSLAARAKDTLTENQARESQIKELQAGISGVSLDEEFANLIKFQRGYEASARMVKIADQLLGELIRMVGG